MASRTNSNRYHNICMVVDLIGESETTSATELSKRCSLSRQAILDILKQAKTWGWVYGEQVAYRSNVQAWIWNKTLVGSDNAKWYMNSYRKAVSKQGQLTLL